MKRRALSICRQTVILILSLACLIFLPVEPRAQEDTPWPAPPPALERGALTDTEVFLVEQALSSINMSWTDLGFRKDYVDDEFRLEVAQKALDDPYSLVVWNYDWDAFLLEPKSASQIIFKAAYDLDSDRFNSVPLAPGTLGALRPQTFSMLPESWQDAVSDLDAAIRLAQDRMESLVLASLTPDEQDYLKWYLICHFTEGESEDCPDEEPYSPPQEFLDAMLKYDIDSLLAVSRELSDSVDSAVNALGAVAADMRFAQPFELQGLSGSVLIGTTGDDVWYMQDWGSPALIIDPGGNDIYYGPVAVAGNIQDEDNPLAAVAIDIGGNDTYLSQDSRSGASGVLGIAMQVDVSGDDVYRAGDMSLGCGLFGVGIFEDLAGNDIYDAGLLVEGAGATGLGLMMDSSGNDDYRAALYAQGMGYVRGWGMLTDRDGFDNYWAGGVYSDFPRYPESNVSLSQGFAIGIRPKASGGVGILHDRNGNDFYSTEVYGQGVSYWYSVGALIDDYGNDWYQSQQYAQGSGIHLSSGILLDRGGIDRYSCHACTQGFGHDLAVGWLIDEAGSDFYTGSGLAQGSGNADGVGILIDRAGDDGYFGRDPEGCQGHGNPLRDYGSIGVLIDMAGHDTYTDHRAGDGAWWTKTCWGVGIDVGDDWWDVQTDAEGNEISRTLRIPGVTI
jgi:hypothetical protein